MKNKWCYWILPVTMLALGGCSDSLKVKSPTVDLTLSQQGEITKMRFGKKKVAREVTGDFAIARTTESGKVSVEALKEGGYEFVREVKCDSLERGARVVERYFPHGEGIRMEIEITATGGDWGSELVSMFRYPVERDSVLFWTAWGNPQLDSASATPAARAYFDQLKQSTAREAITPDPRYEWLDPLVGMPFSNVRYSFGAPYVRPDSKKMGWFIPYQSDIFAIPMVTVLVPEKDAALSIALSPDDVINDLDLYVSAEGELRFERLFNRLRADRPLKLTLDLVGHEADWRSAMAWVSERDRKYFEPINPDVHKLGGTCAYAREFYDYDIDSLNEMAFTTNWQASFDFPYMGMFIPPVAYDEEWIDLSGQPTSAKRMNEYAGRMKQDGFHVMSYFNITEFGNHLVYPRPAQTIQDEAQMWRNANDMVYHRFASAVVSKAERNMAPGEQQDPIGVPYWSWIRCFCVDPGDPTYQAHLIEQAKRHIEYLTNASGICIDRLDWTQLYNEKADDGVSWYAGAPARFLNSSWKETMSKIGPIFHEAGKSILVNNLTKRIDQLEQADGIFCEFGNSGPALNTTGFMTVEKPAMGWIESSQQVRSSGMDYFLQRYLYMGVFPMAPFPGNDHSIQPDDPGVVTLFMDYGKLFNRMKERRWVLEPHAVSVDDGAAKANIFDTPQGYVIPIVYGNQPQVRVRVPEWVAPNGKGVCQVVYPGKDPVEMQYSRMGQQLVFDVPLERECAMIIGIE